MSDLSTRGVYAERNDLIRLRHSATGFNFLPRQPVQSLLAGRHASRLRGRGLNFEEIRRYLPGDDIRQIDWKVTARTQKPHSRVYAEERERPVIMVVDQRMGMFFGSHRQFKSVTAAEAASLVAWRTIAVKDRVGLVLFDDSECQTIRPQRSQAGVLQILQAILHKNHALRADDKSRPAPQMLNQALQQVQRLAKHDCLVTVITDGQGNDAETSKLLSEIAHHNDVLVIFVFDPVEANLPDAGTLIVSDGSRYLAFDSRHSSTRNRYQEEFTEHRAAARQYLLTRETPVLPLSTAEDTLQQVARALNHRLPRIQS